jgi:glycosyltransferase involved in cell wall biosynthesis
MKVLQVVEATSAGVGRHVRGLCEYLIAQDHQLTVAYAPHRMDEQFRQFVANYQNKISFVPLRVGRKISSASDLQAVVQLMRLIRHKGPFDVVHGHSAKGGAIARIAGRCSGVPTVYTPHSLIINSPTISRAQATLYTLIERILGRWATSRIIAVSEGEREFILELGLVKENRVVVIRNAIDDQDPKYFSERSISEDLDQKPLTFGSTIRFSPQKAPEHLIQAFSKLAGMLPHIPMRLMIAGDGELLPKVKRQVEESGLAESISLLGWRAETRDVLRQLDVFVLSSLYEAGFCYALQEAMAAELPVVSTDVFGTEEICSQVPGNVLVSAGDPAALADAMKRMATLSEPRSLRQVLRRIGEANRNYVRTHFRQSETTRRTLEVYQALCSKVG